MKKFIRKAIVAAIITGFGMSSAVAEENCPNCFNKRWIYFGGNVTLAADYAALEKLIVEARKEGFNGIALSSGGDGSFTMLAGVPQNKYALVVANTQKLVTLANANGIELIPVGGGPEVPAAMNPNLVEALPTSTAYTVEGSIGRVKDSANKILDGDFSSTAEWGLDKVWVTVDNSQGHTAAPAIKLSPSDGSTKHANGDPNYNARLLKTLKLPAHKAYRLSFWLKASPGYVTSDLFIQILDVATGAPAYRNGLGWGTNEYGLWEEYSNRELFEKNSADWKKYELTFNTGNFTDLNLWFSNQTKGDPNTYALIDDVELHEVGLTQFPDRANAKPIVTGATSKVTYTQGSDYTIDAKTGSLSIPNGSNIPSGQDVTVSWYHSGVNFAGRWNTPATSCTGDYFYWQSHLYNNLFNLFGNKFTNQQTNKYFMYYDEIRVMNWDPTCPTGNNAANYLAGTVNRVRAQILGAHPSVEVLTWNDMFDPNMNAKPIYWQVNGSLAPSTVQLDPNIVVVNWAGGSGTQSTDDAVRTASLDFFAKRGHKQVAAVYYDKLASVDNWIQILNNPNTPKLDGIMYTSWVYDKNDRYKGYRDLSEVARQLRDNLPGKWPAKQP